jgi:hypothetical protein
VGTAGVLLLAANTAYADFPRLSAILARDRFAPRQLAFRGDRLAFSNGIIFLGATAAVLLIIFQAEVTRLIPLYILGVFISMTLSQSGMVRHWLRLRERGWRTSLVLNGFGAAATFVVVLIVGATKFTEGAWISVLAMLTLFIVFTLIHRHYEWFQHRTRIDETAPTGPAAARVEVSHERVIIPVDDVNRITMNAVQVAREISDNVTAVHITDDTEGATAVAERWKRVAPDIPLQVIESPYRSFTAPLLAYVESIASAAGEVAGQKVVVILPTFQPRHWWERILHNRDVLRVKPFLKANAGVHVVECSYRLDRPS